jgi:hypothetical protein
LANDHVLTSDGFKADRHKLVSERQKVKTC